MIKIMERKSKYLCLESYKQVPIEAEKEKNYFKAFHEAIKQVENEEALMKKTDVVEAVRSKLFDNNHP